MLTKVSNKEVHGSGFSVLVPDVHHVRYTEGKRTTFIEIEAGFDQYGHVNWIIYSRTLTGWEPPFNEDVMSAEKQKEIIANIRESLKLLEMSHEVIE